MKKFCVLLMAVILAMTTAFTAGAEVTQLDYRSSREDVAEVEGMLNALGLLEDARNDGVFDSETIYAIARFQEWVNATVQAGALNVTGAVDEDTMVYLNMAYKMGAAIGEGVDTAKIAAETAPEATAEPTAEPTPEPTAKPTPEVTAKPTPEPTAETTPEATAEPAAEETPEPTAEPTPEPPAAEAEENEKPSAIPEGEPGSASSPVPFDEPFTFTMQVDAEGMPWTKADSKGAIDVPVTVRVTRNLNHDYYVNNYSTKYVLKGSEAGVEMVFELGKFEELKAVSLQDALPVVLSNEAGETQIGYQYTNAEIGGESISDVIPGDTVTLYKRYANGEVEDLDRIELTYFYGGTGYKVYLSILAPGPEDDGIVYSRGDKSDEVKALQEQLIELGFLDGKADGDFGKKTEQAIKDAQESYGLEVTGVADYLLRYELDRNTAPATVDVEESVDPNVPTEETEVVTTDDAASKGATVELVEPQYDPDEIICSKGDKGDDVAQIQRKLIEMGYLFGTPDGQFGGYTEGAIMKVQKKYGLEPTGEVNGELMNLLFGND